MGRPVTVRPNARWLGAARRSRSEPLGIALLESPIVTLAYHVSPGDIAPADQFASHEIIIFSLLRSRPH